MIKKLAVLLLAASGLTASGCAETQDGDEQSCANPRAAESSNSGMRPEELPDSRHLDLHEER